MMKNFLLASILCMSAFANAQTAAKNFTATDCNGATHDLYSELDAGNVVVICWVMPCGACVGPATTANSIVNSYSVSQPGKVRFYLVDDYADSPCSSLNSWAQANGLTNYTPFSTSLIKMLNYGGSGMPKTIILSGGSSHLMYFNQTNGLSSSAFSAALNTALSATAGVTYSLQPSKTVNMLVPVNNPTSKQIGVANTGSQKILVKWEFLSADLPASWEASMTAGTNEYPDVPQGPNALDSIAAGGQSFLQLNVDPKTEDGEGTLKVIVYQNGFRVNADTLTWVINPGNSGITSHNPMTIGIAPNPASTYITFSIPGSTPVTIVNALGTVMHRATVKGSYRFDVTGLPAGVYFVRAANGATARFVRE